MLDSAGPYSFIFTGVNLLYKMDLSRLSSLSNPLATAEQLNNSASQLDSLPVELERALRFQGCLLTQAAGILLRLNQDIISQAVVTFTRFFTGPEGGSFREHAIKVSNSKMLTVSEGVNSYRLRISRLQPCS